MRKFINRKATSNILAPVFDNVCDQVARDILKKREASGIAINGSWFATKANENGYQAVSATEIAYAVQHEANDRRARWSNCNHQTVGDALQRMGWYRLYVARKNFYFLDRAEMERMRNAYADKKAGKRMKLAAKQELREAARAEHGGVCRVFVKRRPASPFAMSRTSYSDGREFIIDPSTCFDEAAKHLAKLRKTGGRVKLVWTGKDWTDSYTWLGYVGKAVQ